MISATKSSNKAVLSKRIVGITKNTLKDIRRRLFYSWLYVPVAKKKHAGINKSIQRSQKHTYTAFNRSPGQLDALCGPVLDRLKISPDSDRLQINILAGSIGAEAYTLASVLLFKFPYLNFHIHCSDLHDETIERSKEALYSQQEVKGFSVSDEFIRQTFLLENNKYRVKQEIREKITFFTANIVSDQLDSIYPKGDIVLIQNVLFHLDDDQAEVAFSNGLKTAKETSAIFIDGMSLDMREKLVGYNRLKALDFQVKKIHEYARRHVPDEWWKYYYGMEPYSYLTPNRLSRYSTIFFR